MERSDLDDNDDDVRRLLQPNRVTSTSSELKAFPAAGTSATGTSAVEVLSSGRGGDKEEKTVFVLDSDEPISDSNGRSGVGGGGGGGGGGGTKRFAEVTYVQILRQFAFLGWTAFGGPAAHIATFEQVFVQSKSWLSSTVFTEFLALGQCVPGPTSTQMAFAIGTVKKGVRGGLLSGSMFLHPGFIMMSIIGGASGGALGEPSAVVKGLVAGFTAVAIALVAGAAVGLGKKICTDKITTVICTLSIVVTVYKSQAWIMPALMLAGGAVTVAAYRKKPNETINKEGASGDVTSLGLTMKMGSVLLAFWLGLLFLVLLIVGVSSSVWAPIKWFKTFYMSGSLIFGGGQVLLPLLLDEMTAKSCEDCDPWMTEDQFFAGLAAAQSMPGPLFNISAYLGAVIAHNAGYVPFFGTIVCWIALFGPGIMLIFGILPFWGWLRTKILYKRALPGINAAAVGLIGTAVFRMLFKARDSSPFPNFSCSIMVLGYTCVQFLKMPAPIAIGIGGILGLIAHAAKLH